MKQLILNSGGFDSVVLLNAVMDNENPDKEKECLFFNWGQANKEQELEKAKKSCDNLVYLTCNRYTSAKFGVV